jgi:hypothetical protein
MMMQDIKDTFFKEGCLVDSQVVFINELSDLKKNRYIEVFAHYGRTFWMVKVKHLTNRRTLILKCYPSYFALNEGGKLLKQWPENAIPV